MQSSLFRAICQVGIFMICAQAIVHFRPNSSYEKYFKLLVSVMVLIQIFQPVSSLFATDTEQNLEERIAWFEQQLNESREKALGSAAESEQLLEQMTLLEVQERLAQQEAGQDGTESQDMSGEQSRNRDGNQGTSGEQSRNQDGNQGTSGEQSGNQDGNQDTSGEQNRNQNSKQDASGEQSRNQDSKQDVSEEQGMVRDGSQNTWGNQGTDADNGGIGISYPQGGTEAEQGQGITPIDRVEKIKVE